MRPLLFSLGPFDFYSYYTFIFMGGIVAFFLAVQRASRSGFPKPSEVLDGTLLMMFAGYWGGRLLHVALHFSNYQNNPIEIFLIRDGGFMLYGTLAAALISILIYIFVKKIRPLQGLDFIAPFFALVYAFIKIGCFLNGCCFGKPCDLPWAMHFPTSDSLVHPTQLYEVFYNFLIFFFLSYRYGRRRFEGEATGLFFFLFGWGRFLIGFWRVQTPPFVFFLSVNQWVEISMMVLGACLYLRRKKGGRL